MKITTKLVTELIPYVKNSRTRLLTPEEEKEEKEIKGKLSDRFLIPPFSVLNAREGWWQERKRFWLSLGIKSELGRGENGGASPGGSIMVAGYDKSGKRLVGLQNIGKSNG
jgi:hypothetical protein